MQQQAYLQADAEGDVRASEQRIRLIVDAAPDAFVAMNAAGLITEWNRQAEVTFGWRRSEVIGRVLAEVLIPSKYREAHSRGLKYYLETGEGPVLNRVVELTAQRRDGTLFPVELSIAPIQVDGEHLFGAFVRDITERKRVEAELHQAKSAAESASRAKSEFLANMSHEIRTPMNGILGMTELALHTELTEEQRDYLNMVKVSAESLLGVIDDILDFSKIEAKRLRLDAVDFSLRESLGDTLKSLALRAQEKGLELACRISPDVPDGLNGDPGRLRQVIVNLAGNAIKFTEKGEVVLDVALASQTPAGVVLSFEIRDTGIGIPADKQQSIFAAFAQADTSTTRHYGGTGLGLTISARLVELMDGHIRVESDAGRGSTFSFTARFAPAKGDVASTAMCQPDSIHDLRVLVVDDNATNRHILQEMLTSWRMRPFVVDSARAALAVLEHAARQGEPFPFVLLDAMMPDMDGFSLAEQIKAHPELAGAVLLMLSSASRAEDAARCRRLGIANYLTKPIKQSELLDAVLTALHNASKQVAPPAPAAQPVAKRDGLRVLVAEDNVINQRLAARLLEKQGHAVVLANNGLEVLALLERERFDVVLMDIQMPQLGGFEAVAALRGRESIKGGYGADGRPIHIVAMTAHAMRGDRERCLAAGMNDYISKPVRAEELYAAISGLHRNEDGANAVALVASGETFDKTQIMSHVGGDLGLLKEIVHVFLASYPGMMSELKQAIERQDAALVHRSAHTLRGVVSNFAARAAMEAAARLEDMGRNKNLSQAADVYSALANALNQLHPALVRLLDGEAKR